MLPETMTRCTWIIQRKTTWGEEKASNKAWEEVSLSCNRISCVSVCKQSWSWDVSAQVSMVWHDIRRCLALHQIVSDRAPHHKTRHLTSSFAIIRTTRACEVSLPLNYTWLSHVRLNKSQEFPPAVTAQLIESLRTEADVFWEEWWNKCSEVVERKHIFKQQFVCSSSSNVKVWQSTEYFWVGPAKRDI